MYCQDDYNVKHTEAGKSNAETVNISPTLSLESVSHQMVHTHLSNMIRYAREDGIV